MGGAIETRLNQQKRVGRDPLHTLKKRASLGALHSPFPPILLQPPSPLTPRNSRAKLDCPAPFFSSCLSNKPFLLATHELSSCFSAQPSLPNLVSFPTASLPVLDERVYLNHHVRPEARYVVPWPRQHPIRLLTIFRWTPGARPVRQDHGPRLAAVLRS